MLGPQLFSIYLNDLGQIIRQCNVAYMMYADDLQLMVSASPSGVVAALAKLEACIEDVRQWYTQNHLVINDEKTEYMALGT